MSDILAFHRTCPGGYGGSSPREITAARLPDFLTVGLRVYSYAV